MAVTLPISAIILAKNAVGTIALTIESVRFCDEVIVIDDDSSDATCSLSRQLGALVYTRKLSGDFAMQRNFGLTKAKNDWVLFVDADEIVSKKLEQEIVSLDFDGSLVGYYLKRRDYFMNKWLVYGETSHVRLLRLARKGVGSWTRPVHEVWRVAGQTESLSNPLDHYPHQSVSDFLSTINSYTEVEATLRSKKSRWSLFETLVFPVAKFVQNYVARLGFLDGFPGLAHAYMMSLHSLLVRIKLYERVYRLD